MKKLIRYSIVFFMCAGNFVNKVDAQTKVKDTSDLVTADAGSSYVPGPLLKISKRESILSTSTVSGCTLSKTPVPNITNTLYGQLAGLTVKQGSGEPGYDNASLSIRGIGTYDNSGLIIYVDGFQTTSAYFQYLPPAEIETVTVLKDPVSLATFGMKGANGVLWIVTKRGAVHKPRVQVQLVNGWQQAININKPYGSYDYARLYNQAISNDNYALNNYQFNWTPSYTDAQLDAYKNGKGINIDWYDQNLKKNGSYSDANVVLTGGDPTTKYALVLDYMTQGGLYNVSNSTRTSNAQIKRFNLRSNLDFSFFKIFEAKVDLGGRIEDRRYPNFNGPSLWENMSKYPSNIYRVKDSVSGYWSGTTLFPANPVASINALGWTSTHDRTLQANFNLKEKLDFLAKGLYLNEAVSFNTWTRNSASKTATYARYYNGATTTTDKTTDITSNGSSPVDQWDWKQVNLTAGYDRSFGMHNVSAAVNYFRSNFVTDWGLNNIGQNTGNNIFYHFENLGAQVHYAYKSKYILELAAGYSGSDNFAPGTKWGLYPAVAAGWIASSEDFLKDNKIVSFLKLRASVGQSANEQSNRGRYLYQQYFVGNGTYYTGTSLTANTGIIQSYAANPNIFAEESLKYNAGFDAIFFNKLSISADVFQDKRSGIVTQNNDLLATYGGTLPYLNIGKVTNKGYEVTANYTNKIGQIGYSVGGMISYAKNKIDYQAEIPTINDFSKTTGLAIGTQMGLIADGFYDITDFNTNGSLKSGIAVPQFGAVQPGDLKYRDLDNNGKVDQNDVTKIGDPGYNDLTYSFNASVDFKGFDFSILFQGASGSSFNLASAYYQTVAFINNINVYPIAKNAWAYYPAQGIDTRAVADYPRLTTKANDNNYRNSTFWMTSGDFLRIRNMEIGYTLPSAVTNRMRLEKLRVYFSAVNPVTWSSLSKDYNIDPETASGYPGLKSLNAGISLNF
ncbi:MAG TPA: SusC/RagA family TonB-linked outer membrane protein [Flavisolibacter sp.]|nr:SusC/RagA family TonB-linked outer membrane protein [Flavisolibacter sp.]